MRCLRTSEVVSIYSRSLRGALTLVEEDQSLSDCAVSYLLVGAMRHEVRTAAIKELLASEACGNFLDDVGRILRQKMLER